MGLIINSDVAQRMVVSPCTGTQRNETLTNCVTTPCMDMKTIGIPPCTGTPGQPPKNGSFYSREGCQHLKFFWRDLHLQERLPKRQVREDIKEMDICDMKRNPLQLNYAERYYLTFSLCFRIDSCNRNFSRTLLAKCDDYEYQILVLQLPA